MVKRDLGEGGGNECSNYLRYLFFLLNGINLLEYVCIHSSKEEGKVATEA